MTTQARAFFRNSRVSSPSIVEDFGCPRCHAQYVITRHQTHSGITPTSDDCDKEFLPSDDGEWLVYSPARCTLSTLSILPIMPPARQAWLTTSAMTLCSVF